MDAPTNDGMLKFTDVMLLIAIVLMWVGLAACVAMIPLIWVAGGQIQSEILKAGIAPGSINLELLLTLMLAGAAAMVYLLIRFFRYLRAIVNSVSEGQPFARINADRLRWMAWLLLVVQGIAVWLSFGAFWISRYSDVIDVDVDFSLTSLLMVLLLFVLSRVFAHGADMRDELEGTV